MNHTQNNMKYSVLNFMFIGLLLGVISSCDTQAESTNTSIDLKSLSGSYARKSFWEHLPEARIWSEALDKYNHYEVSAVDIGSDGIIHLNFRWHEGDILSDSAIEFRKDGLWVKYKTSQWTGPFIRVGTNGTDETTYFNRIFGNSCFTSETNEHWCFQSGTIQIDGIKHKAELMPEVVTMPTYGTPVSLDKETGNFLMFVPTNSGWKIFKDQPYGDGEVNPEKTTPWRKLTLDK